MYVFFFNDTATTEIYTLSLHDALPILVLDAGLELQRRPRVALEVLGLLGLRERPRPDVAVAHDEPQRHEVREAVDRKSTRLNSSHANISYAVFCLKKKKLASLPIRRKL